MKTPIASSFFSTLTQVNTIFCAAYESINESILPSVLLATCFPVFPVSLCTPAREDGRNNVAFRPVASLKNPESGCRISNVLPQIHCETSRFSIVEVFFSKLLGSSLMGLAFGVLIYGAH